MANWTEAERLSYGTMASDWQERINFDKLRKDRAARGLEMMKKYGYPVFILAEASHQRYMTHLHPGVLSGSIIGGAGVSVVFAEYPEDTCAWMVEGGIARQTRFHCPWLKPENIRSIHSMSANQGPAAVNEMCKRNAAEIVQVIRDHGLQKEKIGIDIPISGIIPYLEKAGLHMEAAPQVFAEAHEIKTSEEIKCMQMVGCIGDIAWAALADTIRPGLRENQLAAVMAAAFQEAGAQETFVISLRSGPNTAPNYLSHSPVDRILAPGDLLFADLMGPIYNGYRSCYYRTFSVGLPPKQEMKDAYKKVRDWLYAAADLIKPGASTADVVQVWPKCTEWGYDNEDECWSNALGHGIGLGNYELPSLRRSTSIQFPQEIKKGQTIAMETWTGVDRRWGVRIENVYLVTDTGAQKLYNWPDEEIICPWKQRLM